MRYESVGRGFESLPSHQEKPVHIVCWFFFFVCAMEGARTGRRRIAPQAISPVGCCLARGFQRVGMSTMEAVNRKISWLFCFVSHECTVSARFLHGFCTVGVIHVRLCRALYCIAISALFLRQPEPRCNTLDFAGKVVCQRGAGRHWRPAPLWKPKRNAHQLRCSYSASALIRLPMALTRGTTSAFPMVK